MADESGAKYTTSADSRGTLTLADLERAFDKLKTPAQRIREADEMEVHASEWHDPAMIYLLQPPSLIPGLDPLPLMVICSPDKFDETAKAVNDLRAPIPPAVPEESKP